MKIHNLPSLQLLERKTINFRLASLELTKGWLLQYFKLQNLSTIVLRKWHHVSWPKWHGTPFVNRNVLGLNIQTLWDDNDFKHQSSQPGYAIGDVEHKVIRGLIYTSLNIEHFLRVNGRLIENLAVVFIVRGDRLDLEISVLG